MAPAGAAPMTEILDAKPRKTKNNIVQTLCIQPISAAMGDYRQVIA